MGFCSQTWSSKASTRHPSSGQLDKRNEWWNLLEVSLSQCPKQATRRRGLRLTHLGPKSSRSQGFGGYEGLLFNLWAFRGRHCGLHAYIYTHVYTCMYIYIALSLSLSLSPCIKVLVGTVLGLLASRLWLYKPLLFWSMGGGLPARSPKTANSKQVRYCRNIKHGFGVS